jgi:hypothetical protein
VRFQEKRILIAMEGPEESYLARLHGMLSSGKATRVGDV